MEAARKPLLVFDRFELAPGAVLNATIFRGAVHVLTLESDDLYEDFLARYLTDLAAGRARGDILLEEVRDASGRPRRLGDLAAEQVRGYFARFVGFILRDGGLIETLNVRENLLLPFRFGERWPGGRTSEAEVERRLAALLEFPDAPPFRAWLDRFPADLSLARRRFAAFVRTYVRQPDLVIAFAPFAGLPREARRDLRECIRRYRTLNPASAHLLVLSNSDERHELAGFDLVQLELSSPALLPHE